MLDIRWAPLVGACVVRKEIWAKIPAAARETLLKAATEAGKEIREVEQISRQALSDVRDAIRGYRSQGLPESRRQIPPTRLHTYNSLWRTTWAQVNR